MNSHNLEALGWLPHHITQQIFQKESLSWILFPGFPSLLLQDIFISSHNILINSDCITELESYLCILLWLLKIIFKNFIRIDFWSCKSFIFIAIYYSVYRGSRSYLYISTYNWWTFGLIPVFLLQIILLKILVHVFLMNTCKNFSFSLFFFFWIFSKNFLLNALALVTSTKWSHSYIYWMATIRGWQWKIKRTQCLPWCYSHSKEAFKELSSFCHGSMRMSTQVFLPSGAPRSLGHPAVSCLWGQNPRREVTARYRWPRS